VVEQALDDADWHPCRYDEQITSGVLIGSGIGGVEGIAETALLLRDRGPRRVSPFFIPGRLINLASCYVSIAHALKGPNHAVVTACSTGAHAIGDAAGRFLLLPLGGAAVGVVAGTATVILLRRAAEAELEMLVTLVAAYGSYLLADLLHFSGIVGVVVAGIVVARFGRRSGRLHGTQLLGFWSLLAFVLNAVLFVLVGAALPTAALLRLLPLVLAAYAAMVVVRAVPVYGLLATSDPRGRAIPWSWRHLTFWGGLRGALSVALSLAVAATPGIDPRVSTVAYGVVVLSLLVQGGLIVPLAGRLGLAAASGLGPG